MRQLKITKSITNRESASLDKYLQEIGKEELITVEEEVELAQRIKKGDQEALEKLTKANLRFVVSVAKQYQNQGLSLPDLINEGNIGCMVLGSWAIIQMQEAGDHADDIGYMPFPITVDGKQYASASADYAYGINVNSTADEKKASAAFIKWLTEKSGYAYDQGGIPIVKGETYPETLSAFTNVTLVMDNPTPTGEEDL